MSPEKTINLDSIYEKEKDALGERIKNDPVHFVHRFSDPSNMEIAGFLASQFAYGNIRAMEKFLDGIFVTMGADPAGFLREGDFSAFRDSYYRFQKGDEIILLLSTLRRIGQESGGMGGLMKTFYRGDLPQALREIRTHLFGDGDELTWFFPKPSLSNPLKRWSLYLRWMVRRDEIDRGIWDFIDKGALRVPLDTHLFKIGRCMEWITVRAQNCKAAEEITQALKGFCAEDPLKYDFFLCHRVGIQGGCRGERSPECEGRCVLLNG